MSSQNDEHESVTLFREYLRIPSVQPDVNYDSCVKFLQRIASELKLPINVWEFIPRKPVVVISLVGLDPELPSILLNSHMDVVPVFPENWTYGPFEATKDKNGNIYARGSQDMKCVGIQFIETVRRLIREKQKLRRTIHMSFVPDEEIGGEAGMRVFVNTKEFKALNIGFSIDEGIASPTEEFFLFYEERAIWHLSISCQGITGHGSMLFDNTAGEKIQYVINKFMERRLAEKKKLESNPNLALGNVTTINLTMLRGGVQVNVLPSELKVFFDVRVAPDVEHSELEAEIRKWCAEAGSDVSVEFSVQNPKMGCTVLDSSNPWWMAFKAECDKMGLKLLTRVFPGGTDSRFIRNVGIPALGFSPMNNTPTLLHDNDEYLNENVFLRGIDIYYNIVKGVASV